MKPEDQLMDALLKEQAKKRAADEALLAGIEKALDEKPTPKDSPWRRALPLSIAALIALTAAGIYWTAGSGGGREMARSSKPNVEAPMNVTTSPPPGRRMNEAPVEGLVASMDLADENLVPPAAESMASLDALSVAESPAAPSSAKAKVIAANSASPSEMRAPSAAPTAGQESDGFTGGRGRQDTATGLGKQQLFGRVPMDRSSVDSDAPRLSRRVLVPPARENYGRLIDQPWKSPLDEALSTFSIDVDTASYTNLRRMIREGRSIQPDAVRIEEIVNYFNYRYPAPEGDSPFRVQSLLATCPWNDDHLLARVSIKGREVAKQARPASNLVFLIDVSGSMQSGDKLPLLKRAMRVLIDELDERDRIGVVVYAGTEGVVLPPTRLDQEGKSKAIAALAKLEAGGSTNGGAGLQRAYQMALNHLEDEGVNRVILATDGDFNVGTTGQGQLVEMVKGQAAKGVNLSVLGFGTGNLNDAMMEAITNDGNGNYFYVDGDHEAKRVFLDKLSGTLVTIAKDVKIQVEFNPGKVKAYRLIGYANRVLRNQDFNNDKVDAGDIGAGHTVTAFYEIVPVGVSAPGVGDVDELRYQKPEGRKELVESDDWFTLKLRYKHPEGEKSQLIESTVKGQAISWEEAGSDFRMASAAALFGMKLRNMEGMDDTSWDKVIEIAKPSLAQDPHEQRAEFIELLKKLK